MSFLGSPRGPLQGKHAGVKLCASAILLTMKPGGEEGGGGESGGSDSSVWAVGDGHWQQ